MNPKLLIDAIVRQTTVLIAQLSTVAGVRAPLSRVADQVFLDLAREIEAQGVSRKVAADMFGVALRTYQLKVQRLSASSTERDRTLWEAVLAFIEEEGSVDRQRVLARFDRDEPQTIGAVLADLNSSGFIYRTGSGPSARFRVTPAAERNELLAAQDPEAIAALVWVALYRGAQTPVALTQQLGLKESQVDEALAMLEEQGRLTRSPDGTLSTTGVLVPVGAEHGWEAAVFDHYQAMVTAITRKLATSSFRSDEGDVVGGSTISFEVHANHPLRDEVRGTLRRVRADVNELWRRVGEYNATHPMDATGAQRPEKEIVSFYFGQSTTTGNHE